MRLADCHDYFVILACPGVSKFQKVFFKKLAVGIALTAFFWYNDLA